MASNYKEAVKEKAQFEDEIHRIETLLEECKKYKKDKSIAPNIEGWEKLAENRRPARITQTINNSRNRIKGLKKKVDELNKAYIVPFEETKVKLNGCKVHAIMNNKGGTGKSTITVSLAYQLSQKGFKVLVIDTDSQASTTQLLNIFEGHEENEEMVSLKDLYSLMLRDGYVSWEAIKAVIDDKINKPHYYFRGEPVYYDFDLIPAVVDMLDLEIDMTRSDDGGLYYLLRIMETIKKNRDYDYILIDCPPALSISALNGIAASVDGVIIPINLSVMVLRSTSNVIKTLSRIQKDCMRNGIKHYGVAGILKNEYAKNRRTNTSLEEIVAQLFPINTFKTAIPQRAACAAAEYDRQIFAQQAAIQKEGFFDELCNEIIEIDIKNNNKQPVIVDKVRWDGE